MRLKVLLMGFVAILLVLAASTAAAAKPPGGHLNIEQVIVTVDDNGSGPVTTLTIIGEDLDFGPGPVSVTLGGIGDLNVDDANDTVILASVPNEIPAGDYLLTVANGNGQSQNDEYDLTIGAVGPQGPKGDKGDKGDTGDPGTPGIDGADGAPGRDGFNGLDGQDGANCYDGIGDDVADCIGPKGDKGDKGDQGDTGPPGDPGPPGGFDFDNCNYGYAEQSLLPDQYDLTRFAAACDSGYKSIAGGHGYRALVQGCLYSIATSDKKFYVDGRQGWTVTFLNHTDGCGTSDVFVYAYCCKE